MARLIWVEEDDGVETHRYLGLEGKNLYGAKNVGLAENIPLKKLVQFCEEQAESDNYHSLVPVYEKMSDLLVKHAGHDAATKIFIAIAESEGIQNL